MKTPLAKKNGIAMFIDSKENKFQMTKDLIICTLSSLNILLFSFIGFNYEAFQKLNTYQTAAKAFPNFDHIAWEIIHDLSATTSAHQETTTDPDPRPEPSVLISIPRLNLLAPIKQTGNPENITQTLEQGVLSLQTFNPSEPSGQTILFGHSSDYPWKNNPFGTVFTLLPKLQPGDEILITKNHQVTRYTV
ncbi:MAG: sortase, partial [Candidatus Gracilibacteria bacterium]|nr:sortase [Candidatus Gracilibacteria bacterium]